MDPIKIVLEWNPNYEDESLKERIDNAIVKKVVDGYIANIDDKFKKKIDELVTEQAIHIVRDIKTIPLDTCSGIGDVKKSMLIQDYIVERAIKSLTEKVDSNGRNDGYSSNDKRTPIEWAVKDVIEKGEIGKSLKAEITRIQQEYTINLRNMVNDALSPLYEQLLLKLKSK